MKGRVLIADDDALTVMLVASILMDLGFECVLSTDGDELLQHLAADKTFTVVVTDIAMPWMTGLQVAHSVREAGLQTPVVVMTALPIAESEIRSLGPRARLLRKPFQRAQLLKAIEDVVGPADQPALHR